MNNNNADLTAKFKKILSAQLLEDLKMSECFVKKINCKEIHVVSVHEIFLPEPRLAEHASYLKKYYKSFDALAGSEDNFFRLQQKIKNWEHSLQTSKFHKTPENKLAFEEYLSLKTMVGSLTASEFEDISCFEIKLLLTIFYCLRTSDVAVVEMTLMNEMMTTLPTDFCLHNTESGEFKSFYSRNFFVKYVVEEMLAWLFILAHTCAKTFVLTSFHRIIMLLVLSLEGDGFLKSSHINTVFNGVPIHLVRYDLNFLNNFSSSMDFPLFFWT